VKLVLEGNGSINRVQKCLLLLVESGFLYTLCWVSLVLFKPLTVI